MSETHIVTDLSSRPGYVTKHVVVDGKWTIQVSQPLDLGYGVEPLNIRQAEVIAGRLAIILRRQSIGLGTEWP